MFCSARLRVITPSALARSVRLVYGQFRGYAQQDSQEFLRCIMDRLHDELKRPVMKLPSKRNQRSKRKSHIKHSSKKLLGGNGSSEGNHRSFCLFFVGNFNRKVTGVCYLTSEIKPHNYKFS